MLKLNLFDDQLCNSALRLYRSVLLYACPSNNNINRFVDLDTLSGNGWNALIQIKAIIKFFYSVIKHLEEMLLTILMRLYGKL